MDVFTLTVVNAFISVVVVAVLALQYKAERQFRYQRYFMLAAVCSLFNAGIGIVHYAGYLVPYWLLPAFTNTLSIGAHLALTAGIRRHFQLDNKHFFLLLLFFAVYFLHLTEFASAKTVHRMLIAVPLVVALNMWCIAILWRHRHSEHGKVYLAFIVTFALNILQFSLRSAYITLEHYQLIQGNYAGTVHGVGFFSLTAFAILIFGCMIMLSHSQQRHALLKLSERDPLTGLLNRRSLELRLSSELNRAIRSHQTLSLLLMDIDHFKQINDTRGHAVGDLAIRHIANITNELSRDYDALFRYGGEEYLICLPDTDASTAEQIANRLRLTIEQSPLPVAEPLNMTVSIGIANSAADTDWQALLQQADKALYEAKALGRNCLQSYQNMLSTA